MNALDKNPAVWFNGWQLEMNKTLTVQVQTNLRAHGSSRAICMWRAIRFAGNVEADF